MARCYRLVIPGTLPGLNEYIREERTNRHRAAALKRNVEKTIMAQARIQLGPLRIQRPVMLHYLWIEPNKRRDHDNVAFAQKFVQDALVRAGVLQGDGWRHVAGFSHEFFAQKEKPRLVLTIEEMEP